MTAEKYNWLIERADDLGARYYRDGAVSIRRILNELQLPLVKRVDPLAKKQRGEIEIVSPNSYRVVLIRNASEEAGLSAKERFSLAHELAHILLIKKFRWNPRTGREYYKLEEACDAFAGRLLVPTSAISSIEWQNPHDALKVVSNLRRKLKVSWEVIARQFSNHHDGLTMCLSFRGASRFKKRYKKDAIWVEWSYGACGAPLFRDCVRRYFISSDRTVADEILSKWEHLRTFNDNIIEVKGLLIAGQPVQNNGIICGISRIIKTPPLQEVGS